MHVQLCVQPLSYRVSRLESDIETHTVVSVAQELTEMFSSEHSMPSKPQ